MNIICQYYFIAHNMHCPHTCMHAYVHKYMKMCIVDVDAFDTIFLLLFLRYKSKPCMESNIRY